MRNKAYRYRIYPNKEQEELIQKTFGCVRFVYNHFLDDRLTAYKERGESRTFFQQNKALTKLKQEYTWLREPDKNALQNALRDLNAAYQNFSVALKTGNTSDSRSSKARNTTGNLMQRRQTEARFVCKEMQLFSQNFAA